MTQRPQGPRCPQHSQGTPFWEGGTAHREASGGLPITRASSRGALCLLPANSFTGTCAASWPPSQSSAGAKGAAPGAACLSFPIQQQPWVQMGQAPAPTYRNYGRPETTPKRSSPKPVHKPQAPPEPSCPAGLPTPLPSSGQQLPAIEKSQSTQPSGVSSFKSAPVCTASHWHGRSPSLPKVLPLAFCEPLARDQI